MLWHDVCESLWNKKTDQSISKIALSAMPELAADQPTGTRG
jgi:hypothetical protein